MRLETFYTMDSRRRSITIDLDQVSAVLACEPDGYAVNCKIYTPGHVHHVRADAEKVKTLLGRSGF